MRHSAPFRHIRSHLLQTRKSVPLETSRSRPLFLPYCSITARVAMSPTFTAGMQITELADILAPLFIKHGYAFLYPFLRRDDRTSRPTLWAAFLSHCRSWKPQLSIRRITSLCRMFRLRNRVKE